MEASPPGGVTIDTGVLFADLRGFTALSEGSTPREVSELLRRFYKCAEDVLFPEAIIDKLIGDEVMALYLPSCVPTSPTTSSSALMLDHAQALLPRSATARTQRPFVEIGIGLDFGEAFVGNIGQRALYDFTAVGDVVNTASRLQGEAAGGEIVLSERVASGLENPNPGEAVLLRLKGKTKPLPRRIGSRAWLRLHPGLSSESLRVTQLSGLALGAGERDSIGAGNFYGGGQHG